MVGKLTARKQNGFTLVEALVAGILVAIMAGAGMSVFIMYLSETRESTAQQKMQRQYETLLQEIARNTRNASAVLAGTEDPATFICDTLDTSLTKASEIRMYRGTKLIAGFHIVNDTVREYDTTAQAWKHFEAGGGVILANNDSTFSLSGCRNRLYINLELKTTNKDVFYLEPRKDLYLCRN